MPISRVVAATAYVQQRGGGDFTDPFRDRPGLLGLVCLCYRARSAPADGGGGSPPGGCVVAVLRLQWPGVFLHVASGRLLSMAVEVDPSRVFVVLPLCLWRVLLSLIGRTVLA